MEVRVHAICRLNSSVSANKIALELGKSTLEDWKITEVTEHLSSNQTSESRIKVCKHTKKGEQWKVEETLFLWHEYVTGSLSLEYQYQDHYFR